MKGVLPETVPFVSEVIDQKVKARSAVFLDNSNKEKRVRDKTKKRKRMSGREAKRLGLFDLPPEECWLVND